MSADRGGVSVSVAGRARHRLRQDEFAALAAGDGDAGVIATLLSAERSRRLVAFRALLDQLALADAASGEPLPSPDAAWNLLERAQRAAPEAVDEVLLYPHTGAWLRHTLRRLRGVSRAPNPVPLWVDVAHLNAIAAAAALRAGVEFQIAAPARDGVVALPGLGQVRLAVDGYRWAWLRAGQRVARIECAGTVISIPAGPDAAERAEVAGGAWRPVRTLRARAHGRSLTLGLDDADPYRSLVFPDPPTGLSERAVARWRVRLAQAWELLATDLPEVADAMAAGLRTLVPLEAGELFRMRSGSTGDAFGSVVVSEPPGGEQFAVTLAHEFQHVKLGGLLAMAPLTRPADGRLHYAPWRDDPRPAAGLLQGVYAFFGVTRFWRARKRSARGPAAALAAFEFALWRQQTWRGLNLLRSSGELTEVGSRFLDLLAERLSPWLREPVASRAHALADLAAADHAARWRLAHLRPAAGQVDRLAAAWRGQGDAPPRPSTDPASAPRLVPDPTAEWFDSRAVLARLSLLDPAEFATVAEPRRLRRLVPGAAAPDVPLVAGEVAEAEAGYRRLADGGQDDALIGLALARVAVGDPVGQALLAQPELVAAVRARVRDADGAAPEPLALAAWLGGLERPDQPPPVGRP